jgi:PTS system fructose-specific IIC component
MAAVTVTFDLVAPNAPAAIRQLGASLAGAPGVVDAAQLVVDVLAREVLVPTYLGRGLALPHARTDAVTARVVAIGRSAEGVPFGPQNEPAQLIVLIGCPRAEVGAYLEFSKLLLRRLRQPAILAELLATPDTAEFLKLLELDAETAAIGVAQP